MNKPRLLRQYYDDIMEAKECYPDEELEYSYLDAVESAGEVPEWVVHIGSYVIEDGLTEREAEKLWDDLLGEFF